MEDAQKPFTPPQFVELPPSKDVAVVKDADKTGIDVTYVSSEGRQLTVRVVLDSAQAAALARDLA